MKKLVAIMMTLVILMMSSSVAFAAGPNDTVYSAQKVISSEIVRSHLFAISDIVAIDFDEHDYPIVITEVFGWTFIIRYYGGTDFEYLYGVNDFESYYNPVEKNLIFEDYVLPLADIMASERNINFFVGVLCHNWFSSEEDMD